MQDRVVPNTTFVEDGENQVLDRKEEEAALENEEIGGFAAGMKAAIQRASPFRAILICLAIVLLIIVVSIVAATSSANDEEEAVAEELVGCKGINEDQRQAIREIIAQEADIQLTPSGYTTTLFVNVTNVELNCLPNDALSLLNLEVDFKQVNDLEILFTDCNILEAEEDALQIKDAFSTAIGFATVSVDLSQNQLSFLPDLLFAPFDKFGTFIDLSHNLFVEFPNERYLFDIPLLRGLILDGNNIKRLPAIIKAPEIIKTRISCKGCYELEFVDKNYCAFNKNFVRLDVIDTPLSVSGLYFLSQFTGCNKYDVEVGEVPNIDRDILADCRNITANERVFLRKQLFDNVYVGGDTCVNGRFNLNLGYWDIGCLPDNAFFFVDDLQELLQNNRVDLFMNLQNRKIKEIQEDAFAEFGTLPYDVNSITFDLNLEGNLLSALEPNVFSPFKGRIFSLNLGSNQIIDLPQNLFEGIFVENLDFSDNLFTALPLFPGLTTLAQNGIHISCSNCEKLFEVEEGYCDLTLADADDILKLNLEWTPLGRDEGADYLAKRTGCEAENILVGDKGLEG